MTRKFILAEDIEDDGYNCYIPAENEKVFGFLLDFDEYEIYVSKDYKIEDASPVLSEYMDFLASCKKEILEYFEEKTGDKMSEEWYSTIEVYNVALTFNSPEDFGAVIVFGDSAFEDNIFELEFEKFEIIESRIGE